MNSDLKNPEDDNQKKTSIISETPLTLPGRVIESLDLLQGQREVWIQHGEEIYRLRVTSKDKLYLTK